MSSDYGEENINKIISLVKRTHVFKTVHGKHD